MKAEPCVRSVADHIGWAHVVCVVVALTAEDDSQAKELTALKLEARAALLQSQLDYVQATDEMDAAIGRRAR